MRATEGHSGAQEVNKAFVTLKDAQASESVGNAAKGDP